MLSSTLWLAKQPTQILLSRWSTHSEYFHPERFLLSSFNAFSSPVSIEVLLVAEYMEQNLTWIATKVFLNIIFQSSHITCSSSPSWLIRNTSMNICCNFYILFAFAKTAVYDPFTGHLSVSWNRELFFQIFSCYSRNPVCNGQLPLACLFLQVSLRICTLCQAAAKSVVLQHRYKRRTVYHTYTMSDRQEKTLG